MSNVRQARRKWRTEYSFESLTKRMATLTYATKEVGRVLFDEVVLPTELQDRALEFLGIKSLL